MQEVRGKRENTSRYIYEGYEYHVDSTSVNVYRCSKRASTGCRGTARIVEGDRVVVHHPHEGHLPNDTLLEECNLRSEMLDLSSSTNTPLKEIFDDVCRRNPVIAPKFSFPKIRSAMQRARAKVRPVIPENLRDLAVVLETYEPTQGVYRGVVEANDGSVALIFSSERMLDSLRTATEIYVDGTFKVAPYRPPMAQLYTIHMRVMDTGIAAVFVLCSSRTQALYSAIFSKLKDLAPGMAENLRFVMGDYERAAMNALRDAFPQASLHGCWFYFNQALIRRWRRLGLSDARTSILSMAMALPLAPADRFDEGLGLLTEMADEIAVDHPDTLQLMRYLRRQWSPIANVVSVHDCPSRTNNLVESFHNEAKRKLGGLHPNIWKFIEHLTDLVGSQETDLTRLRNGERARRARTVRNMARDSYIRDAQHDLSVGRYTLKDFLARCANRTVGFYLEQRNRRDELDEEPEIIQPGLMEAGEPVANEPAARGGRRGRRNRGAAAEIGDPAVAERGARNRGRGRGTRPRQDADQGEDVAPPENVRRPVRPAGRAQQPPEEEADDPLPADPAVEIIDPVDDNDADFHLPEDEFEQIRISDEGVPFHPVGPLPAVEEDAQERVVRPPGICVVCLAEPATHAFVPCGHQCCCANCAEQITDRCPLCRSDMIGAFRIRVDP